PSPPAATPSPYTALFRSAACSSQFLRDTHDRAARTRVGLELFGRGVLRLADQLEARHESLGDDRQIARQGIRLALGMAAHELLDDAVFQRMEADHHQPAAHFQRLQCGLEAGLEIAKLVVDEDAQPLE